METPVRQYLKYKDYLRHKLFRKIKRHRKAERQLAIDAPMKELRKRLKVPKFGDGKDDIIYKVKEGDWLSKIARDYTSGMGTYHYLATYNNIQNPDRLEPGDIIRIPKSIQKNSKAGSIEDTMLAPPNKQLSFATWGNEPRVWNHTTDLYYEKTLPETVITGKKKQREKYKPIPFEKPPTYVSTANFDLSNQPNIKTSGDVASRSDINWQLLAKQLANTKLDFLNTRPQQKKQLKGVIFPLSNIIGNETIQDIKDTFSNNDWGLILGIAKNFLQRKVIDTQKESATSTGIKQPVSIDDGGSSFYGDTIHHTYLPVSDRQYLLPGNINMRDIKLSSRNRGDYRPVDTEAVLFTSYPNNPFVPFDEYIKKVPRNLLYHDHQGNTNEYYGYDKDGNFKVGTIDLFGSGDTLAKTYWGYIDSIPQTRGQYEYKLGGWKDSRRYAPIYYGRSESDITNRRPMNKKVFPLMTDRNKITPNKYDNVVGGSMLVTIGDEQRLLTGSINDILGLILKLQKKYKGKPIKFYEIDQASYNRGLRTLDAHVSEKDWRNFDAQNPVGGHSIYIKPKTAQKIQNIYRQ